MAHGIPFEKIDDILVSLEEALQEKTISGKISVPLISVDGQKLVKEGQQKAFQGIMMKASGLSLLSSLRCKRDERIAETTLGAKRCERHEAKRWLEAAEALLTAAKAEQNQTIPNLTDLDDAREVMVTFSALSKEDAKKLEQQIERGRVEIGKLDESIHEILKGRDLDIEISDEQHRVLALMCPAYSYDNPR
jgi:hypothetical protein